jgi:ABC-2 type transport system ATP-binding protein
MKQKLALACTLIHTPDIIFLDEPTTGVDPVSRRDFWKILSTLLKQGITIIVSTPYLDEAERSSRVAMMNEGRILQCDSPEAIKQQFPFEVMELVCSDVRRAAEIAQTELGKGNTQMFGDRLHLLTPKGGNSHQSLLRRLRRERIVVKSSRAVSPSLEDVFIEAVQR